MQFCVRELFGFVRALERLRDFVGEFIPEDSIDLSEGDQFEVSCKGELTTGRVEALGQVGSVGVVLGLDSQSSRLRFEGVDVYVVTGALVGPRNALVPGLPNAHWLGLRFRFRANEEALKGLEGEIGGFALVRSRVLGRVFDGAYNEEAVRDEVRTEVETRLVEEFRGLGLGDALLMVDGPIFPTPRVLTMSDNPYAELYMGFIQRRVEALRGVRAVGVVKRLGQSTYLAKCLGFGVDDDTLVKNQVTRSLGGGVYTAVVGPITIRVGDYTKYCWYVASRLGNSMSVVRVEALDRDLAMLGAVYVARTMGLDGVPIPIRLADRLARRLNAGITNLLASLAPLRLTYEGLEELNKALRELGG